MKITELPTGETVCQNFTLTILSTPQGTIHPPLTVYMLRSVAKNIFLLLGGVTTEVIVELHGERRHTVGRKCQRRRVF